MNQRQYAAVRRSKQLVRTTPKLSDHLHERAVVEEPTITLSTLARAMGPLSPAALTRLLAGTSTARPVRAAAISVHASKRSRCSRTGPDAALRTHERDAVAAMQRASLRLPERSRALRANASLPYWEIQGVHVSMQPDVELDGSDGTGAAKLVFTKQRLPNGIGAAMAALLWNHRKNVLGLESTRRDHCIVYEPRLPWLHLPSPRAGAHLRHAEIGCKVIEAL